MCLSFTQGYKCAHTMVVTSENTVYRSILASAVKFSCVFGSMRRCAISVALCQKSANWSIEVKLTLWGVYSRVVVKKLYHKSPYFCV